MGEAYAIVSDSRLWLCRRIHTATASRQLLHQSTLSKRAFYDNPDNENLLAFTNYLKSSFQRKYACSSTKLKTPEKCQKNLNGARIHRMVARAVLVTRIRCVNLLTTILVDYVRKSSEHSSYRGP